MSMFLSVVVCTCNHARTLAETLRCLAAQDADPVSYEVTVVDNRCTDETPAVVEAARAALPGLRVVEEPIPGQAHARVRGVRESRGEWVAFVDDDNYLTQDWVSTASRFAANHPACGVFGGKVSVYWEATPPREVERRAYAYAATDLSNGDGYATARRLDGEERWRLRGAGLVCRRAALVDAGWLDWQANVGRVGRGALAGDDTEIVMRVARGGWEVWYEPACHLRHAIAAERLTVAHLRALHRGFGAADGLLLGFRESGSLARWGGRFALLLARRTYWLARHAWRGVRDQDARLTARLSLDTLQGNLRGLAAVARLDRHTQRSWLGQKRRANSTTGTLRVLHVHSGRDYGGLERMLLCLGAERESAAGMEPIFALGYRHRLARELSAVGARVEVLGAFTRRQPWRGLQAVGRQWRLLGRERVDALVCHGSSALAVFGWLARVRGVPLVLWMHSDTKVRHKNLIESAAGHARPALVVCNSAFTARSLPLLFRSPPPHIVLHCPVSPRAAQAAVRPRLRAELSTEEDDVVIILPGRLEMWKGHGQLLAALGTLRELPGWTCWLVGGPFNEEQAGTLAALRDTARRLGIDGRVRFTGQREDVPDLLVAADIFCQPNLTGEPFGINAVEALYAGLPVVGSDSGGTREIVDNSCGRLVPPGDSVALAAELAALVRDPVLRRALATNAPARARLISDPGKILTSLRGALVGLSKSASGYPAGASRELLHG